MEVYLPQQLLLDGRIDCDAATVKGLNLLREASILFLFFVGHGYGKDWAKEMAWIF